MLILRLPPDVERRLEALTRKTGRAKSFFAREAILRHIEDLEDYYFAKRRLARKADGIPLDEIENELSERGR